jgi:EpsI family protein
MQLNGAGETSTPVNQVMVTMATTRLSIVYWYQLGPRTIADEYRFRLALFLNTLLAGGERPALVRVATAADAEQEGTRPSTAEKFLRAFYPELMRALAN